MSRNRDVEIQAVEFIGLGCIEPWSWWRKRDGVEVTRRLWTIRSDEDIHISEKYFLWYDTDETLP